MIRILFVASLVAVLSVSSVHAQSANEAPVRSQKSMLKETGKFDPQRLIGLSLDTVRVFMAMIGRVTEEQTPAGLTHLHAVAADSMPHGIRPSEADAMVGKKGTEMFTARFFKLNDDQLKKLGARDFGGGKVLNYNADVEWPNAMANIMMDRRNGTFMISCRAK